VKNVNYIIPKQKKQGQAIFNKNIKYFEGKLKIMIKLKGAKMQISKLSHFSNFGG